MIKHVLLYKAYAGSFGQSEEVFYGSHITILIAARIVRGGSVFVLVLLFTIASAMVIYVSNLPWARVRFGPVPLASCGNTGHEWIG